MSSMILSHAASEVVKQLLIDLGVGTNSLSYDDWPVYSNNEPDSPDNCITLTDTAGMNDGKLQINGEVQDQCGLQVRVRATDFMLGRDRMTEIMQKLDTACRAAVSLQQRIGTAMSSYLIHSAERASGMFAIGSDPTNSERELFTSNYLVSITEE